MLLVHGQADSAGLDNPSGHRPRVRGERLLQAQPAQWALLLAGHIAVARLICLQ